MIWHLFIHGTHDGIIYTYAIAHQTPTTLSTTYSTHRHQLTVYSVTFCPPLVSREMFTSTSNRLSTATSTLSMMGTVGRSRDIISHSLAILAFISMTGGASMQMWRAHVRYTSVEALPTHYSTHYTKYVRAHLLLYAMYTPESAVVKVSTVLPFNIMYTAYSVITHLNLVF